MPKVKPTMDEMVAAVKTYAVKHYSRGGWDMVRECFEDQEIRAELELEKITCVSRALRHFSKNIAAPYADRRKDVCADIF